MSIDRHYAVVIRFSESLTCKVYIAEDNNLYDAMMNVLDWDHIARDVVAAFNNSTPVSVTVCEPTRQQIDKHNELLRQHDELTPVYEGPITKAVVAQVYGIGGGR